MCVYTRSSVCVYIHVLRMYTCLCVCIRICVSVCTRVYTCGHARMHLLLHGYIGVHAPIVCVRIIILYASRGGQLHSLGYRLRHVSYLTSSAFSVRQIGAVSVFAFQFLVHFTEDSRGANNVGRLQTRVVSSFF